MEEEGWNSKSVVKCCTWISGRSTRMNGLVSSSSSIVDGMVWWPALLCCSDHSSFCLIFSLSGSTVKANCKFFTVYCNICKTTGKLRIKNTDFQQYGGIQLVTKSDIIRIFRVKRIQWCSIEDSTLILFRNI